MSDAEEERFLEIVTADLTVRAVLERAPTLGLGEWWLTAGLLFQTVWNSLTSGTRSEMMNLERWIVQRDRGPLNRERWRFGK